MSAMSQVEDLPACPDFSETRRDILKARHLPGYVYTSPEIYEREVDQIFMKDWLCVARVEEFQNPGDYQALRITTEPVIICRGEDGALNAFSNVCAHRGVEVIRGEGTVKEFSCPYHGWLYDLEGRLAGAPHRKGVEDFDFANCRLPQLKIDTWGGFVFINFDSAAPPLGEYLDVDDIRKEADFLRHEDTRMADKFVTEINCNWKLVTENLMDIYHVGVIHSTSFGKNFPVDNFKFNLTRRGYHAFYQSLTMAPEGVSLFGPIPWLKDKDPMFACTFLVPPNMNLFGRFDVLQPWIVYPLGPDRCVITIYTLFPKEYFDMPAFDERAQIYRDFIRLVGDEDKEMIESLQRGFKSRAYKPGPMVGLEAAIHNRINVYIDRIFGTEK